LGFMTKAQVLIKAKTKDRQKIREYLQKHHHVNSLVKINNGYDFMVELVFRHVQDLEAFMEVLDDRFTIKKQVHYILNDIRKEGFLSDPSLIDTVTAT